MTSSLVGSEMCIRDSMRGTTMVDGITTWPTVEKELKKSRYTLSQEEEAVSYTHLTLPTICSV
eukprot:10001179-Prorocentrum_lima.AAC.1